MDFSKQVKNKINKLTYDKNKLNSRIIQMQKSFEEVNKMINGKSGK